MNPKNIDFVFKVVIVGDSLVGKTTLLKKYIGEHDVDKDFGRCSGNIKQPYLQKTVDLGCNTVCLEIHDTMGQERFRSLTRSYYRGAHGCLICFDVNNRKSFDNLWMWLHDVQEIQNSDIMCIVKLLVGINNQHGNQTTCQTPTSVEPRVTQTSAENFAHSHDMQYCEVDLNIESTIAACFANLVEQMIHTRKSNPYGVQYPERLKKYKAQETPAESSTCFC